MNHTWHAVWYTSASSIFGTHLYGTAIKSWTTSHVGFGFWDWVSYLSLFSALMRCHYRRVTFDGCNVASASRSCSARLTDGQIDDFAHGCGVTQILRQNCDDLCDRTILLGSGTVGHVLVSAVITHRI